MNIPPTAYVPQEVLLILSYLKSAKSFEKNVSYLFP